MLQKSLKKNAFFNFIKSVLNTAYPIITFPYVSRILMPEGLGKVNFANSIIEYFLIVAELGISTYALEANRIDEYRKIISKVCGVAYFFALPASAGLFFGRTIA